MGRPKFEPTNDQRKMVEALAGCGIPHADICQVIEKPDGKPITGPTLRRAFRRELDRAAPKANAKVVGALFRAATDPEHPQFATCNIWWTKCRMRWSGPSEKPREAPENEGRSIQPPRLALTLNVEDDGDDSESG